MNDTPDRYIFHPLAPDNGKRLDVFLAEQLEGWSRSRIRKLIDDGEITVNERSAKASHRVRENESVEADLTESIESRFEPQDIPLDIVYEDDYLAVINKPAGMVVHPGAGVTSGTLANAIAFKFEISNSDAAQTRVGIVHRLDKDTSGLIVVARDEQTAEELSRQFHDREVEKTYVALVHGNVEQNSGKIDAAIARNKHNRLRMKVAPSGRSALSLWRVRERYEKFTLLDVEIKTGRTHQIRVHMAYINHPIVGDEIYNGGRDNTVADVTVRNAIRSMNRFFLHAERLAFTHPKTGERMDFKQELAVELDVFLKLL